MSKFQSVSPSGPSVSAKQVPLDREQLLSAVSHLEQVLEMQLTLLQAIRAQIDVNEPASVDGVPPTPL